jgi:hypothetical protein
MTHLSQMFTLNYFRSSSSELNPEFWKNGLNHTSPGRVFSSLAKLHFMSRMEELDGGLSQVA